MRGGCPSATGNGYRTTAHCNYGATYGDAAAPDRSSHRRRGSNSDTGAGTYARSNTGAYPGGHSEANSDIHTGAYPGGYS